MKVLSMRKIEGCLESSNAWDLLLENTISKEFIFSLTEFGKLVYHREFEKPFFRLIAKGNYSVKGTEGNHTLRMILPEGESQEKINLFIKMIEKL